MEDKECDAGLGNGGLGRLAASLDLISRTWKTRSVMLD